MNERRTRAPVTSKGDERIATAPASNYSEVGSTVQPARDVRRGKQEAARIQAFKDAQLVPPSGAEKAAQIAKNKQKQIAATTVGDSVRRSARKAAQIAHAAQAVQEAVTLAVPGPAPGIGTLTPGTQPTLLQLRRMAKEVRLDQRSEASELGKAAGIAVRDTLLGRTGTKPEKFRRFRNFTQRQDAANTKE